MTTYIAVYFDAPAFDGYPFDEIDYRTAYSQLAQAIVDRGGRFFIARGDSSLGDNRFARGWVFNNGYFEEHRVPFTTHCVLNKGHLEKNHTNMVNDPAFDTLCNDKWRTFQEYREFCPKTVLLASKEDIPNALEKLSGDTLVAKPLDSFGGDGVIIGDRNDVAKSIPLYPYILQELIDTEAGIPGLTDSTHDFRIISIAGDIVYANMRIPPGDSLVANVSQGGKEIGLELSQVPPEAERIWKKIDATLEDFPTRVYSLDLGRDRNGEWKIIEMNAQPGLSPREVHPGAGHYIDTLADHLIHTGLKKM